MRRKKGQKDKEQDGSLRISGLISSLLLTGREATHCTSFHSFTILLFLSLSRSPSLSPVQAFQTNQASLLRSQRREAASFPLRLLHTPISPLLPSHPHASFFLPSSQSLLPPPSRSFIFIRPPSGLSGEWISGLGGGWRVRTASSTQ